TFLLINIYGWFLPGTFVDPTKEPASLSLITIIAIVLTLQAAFPTLINYILIVVGIGIIKKFIGAILFIPSLILRRPLEEKKEEEIFIETSETPVFDEFLEELAVPILSVLPLEGRKIKKYVGLVAGEAVAEEKEVEGRVLKLTKIIEPTLLEDMYLGEARKLAISRMLNEAKSIGANNVVDVIVDYVSMGGFQGTALIVTATGTAVIVQDGSNPDKEITNKGPLSKSNEELNDPKTIENISDSNEMINGITDEKDISKANKNISGVVERRRVSSQIIGKEVIDDSGTVIGKVKDVEINLDNNEIEEVILEKEGLGLSKEEIIIHYDAIEQIGDKVLIKKISIDESIDSDYYSYLERKIRDINI
ncbi:MAG TPA: heavy metal-binding domain-containing protein, partial [Methanobacterium sp.]|nr:heavy metal-binding domain-containing protein [Methanobacterium sp.]